MNARWVLDTFWPELPQLDHTIVARWWPWDYYCVSTICVWEDTTDLKYKGIRPNAVASMQFVTHVYKCDKNGRVKKNHCYYLQEYPDSVLARRGHKKVVGLLEKGSLDLSNQVS
jgi:hypothetical protein